jgi:hypothetical protein
LLVDRAPKHQRARAGLGGWRGRDGVRQVAAENLRRCFPRGGGWSSRGALYQRQEQQGPTTTATCYVVMLSQARGRMKPGKDLVAVDSSAMACTAGTELIPIKQHTTLTAFVARVCTVQWRQPVLSVCLSGKPLSGCRSCRGLSGQRFRRR